MHFHRTQSVELLSLTNVRNIRYLQNLCMQITWWQLHFGCYFLSDSENYYTQNVVDGACFSTGNFETEVENFSVLKHA